MLLTVLPTFSQRAAVIRKKDAVSLPFAIYIVTDFKLDPPARAKAQAALVSVTGVIDTDADSVVQPVNMLLVDNVHLLALQEAETLKPIFSKMLYFAALTGQVSRKKEHEP